MSSVMDLLANHLDENRLRQLGQAVGADDAQIHNAVGTALPDLIASLARSASMDQGAAQLHVLHRDHDGSALDQIQGLTGGSGVGGTAVETMLKRMLGNKQQSVEQGIGKLSGLDSGAVTKLLGMLAPMVLGAIGRQQRQQKMNPGDLSGYLRKEQESMPQKSSGGASFIGRMLDQDGDGDFDLSDALKLGANMLFGRKK